jgi:hypothetical protein
MKLSRRHALAGAATIAAAPLLSGPGKAAASVSDKQAPSFLRHKVGDIQVTVVSDGRNTFTLDDKFIANAKREEVSAALQQAFLPADVMTVYFAPLVINTGGKLVVLDTGNWSAGQDQQQGDERPVRRQRGGRGLRSQGRRQGGDFAFRETYNLWGYVACEIQSRRASKYGSTRRVTRYRARTLVALHGQALRSRLWRPGVDRFGVLTKIGRGLIAAPMINAATILIVRCRRSLAVRAVVCG